MLIVLGIFFRCTSIACFTAGKILIDNILDTLLLSEVFLVFPLSSIAPDLPTHDRKDGALRFASIPKNGLTM